MCCNRIISKYKILICTKTERFNHAQICLRHSTTGFVFDREMARSGSCYLIFSFLGILSQFARENVPKHDSLGTLLTIITKGIVSLDWHENMNSSCFPPTFEFFKSFFSLNYSIFGSSLIR